MVQRLQPLGVAQHLGVTPELLVSLCVCRCESEGEVTKIGIWGVFILNERGVLLTKKGK